jgi:SAM-dependent MidA family methyltransferase
MLKDLLRQRAECEAQMTTLQGQIGAINIDIEHVLAEQLAGLRKLQAKEFGAINLTVDGIKVTETVPKKVDWDQAKMNDLFDAIATAGDDPRAYMKMTLAVAEKAFTEFAPEVRAMFSDCRTVTPGRASLKFEEVTNA